MCGICGYAPAEPAARVPPEYIEQMAATLRHRGPDGTGFHLAPGIGLSAQRLAIVDPEHGRQPLANEDGSVIVVANGEIYNAPELRYELRAMGHRFATRSDVEPIVHLYEEHGPECLRFLRGMFALALWDARAGTLLLARDRLGIKPLYYATDGAGLWFASEQKAILAARADCRRLDVASLGRFITRGFISAPDSLLAGIHQLQPGHRLVYGGGRLTQSRYWEVPVPQAEGESARSADDWAQAVRAKLEETVGLHLRSDVPMAAWLSSGIDSSAVVALMARGGGPVQTFSLSFEDDPADEIGRTDVLSGLGRHVTNHRIRFSRSDLTLLAEAMWFAESPAIFGLELPRFALARATAEEFKVVLTGEGADELFGGYRWIRALDRSRRLARLPRPLAAFARTAARATGRGRTIALGDSALDLPQYAALVRRGQGLVAGLLSSDLATQIGHFEATENQVGAAPDGANWPAEARMHYLDATVFLPDVILPALDRMTMARSLEGRVPFLDHELVELVVGAPAALKRPRPMEKMLLRNALRDVLPAATLSRPKRAFRMANRAWLAGNLPDYAAELLGPSRLKTNGYFDPERVAGLLARRRQLGENEAGALLAVLGLQLWDQIFLRGGGPAA